MTTRTDAVPTATPYELTYRVGWDVVEQVPQQVTVRIRRVAEYEPDPGDSDGIPQAVDLDEVSCRGVVTSGHTTIDTFLLTTAEKVQVLMALTELSYRHGHGDILEYPIAVPDGGVRLLVLRWKAFARWYESLARFEFEELRPYLIALPHRARAGGLSFLMDLAQVVPRLAQFDDTPHLLLQL